MMRKLTSAVVALSSLVSQTAYAAPLPSKLTGVIIFSCVTTDAGTKVDEDIYKIDFNKSRVNERPVAFEITDLSLGWEYLPKRTDEQKRQRIDISGADGASISRYSGKFESGGWFSGSKRMTVCHVAGRRKF